jgi:diguanylate cyclase (GGDEF)-like protein
MLAEGPINRAAVGLAVLHACPRGAHGARAAAPPALAAILGDAHSWVVVPLNAHGHGHGALIAGSAAASFAHAHQDLLAALAGQAASAYDNARLFAKVQLLATTDELTGAPNRRQFIAAATDQLLIARRNHRPLVGIMVDIDHFKQVNDTHGHATGDEVIRTVAAVLRAHIRVPGVLGRYGGEEFAVVQSETLSDPTELGERLRAAVDAVTVPGPDGPIGVTISVGVAELKPEDTLDTLLGRADGALYRAKEAGRNRVMTG